LCGRGTIRRALAQECCMSGSPFPSLGPRYTLRSRPVCGPYGRETARMCTGLRPQSVARVVQVRRARRGAAGACGRKQLFSQHFPEVAPGAHCTQCGAHCAQCSHLLRRVCRRQCPPARHSRPDVVLPMLTLLSTLLYVVLPKTSLNFCGNSGLFMSCFP